MIFTPEGSRTFSAMSLATITVLTALLVLNFGGLLSAVESHIASEEAEIVEKQGNATSVTFSLTELFSCGQYGARAVVFQATLPSVAYWVVAWILMVFDVHYEATGQLSAKKNRHPGFTARLDHALYRKAVVWALGITVWSVCAHILVFSPLQRFFNLNSMCRLGAPLFPGDVLSVLILLVKVYAMWLLADVIFYTTHRLCHEVPFVYKHIHKIHHQWVVSYGVDAGTCHPLEHLMCNLMTATLPGILVGLPFHLQTAWLVAAAVNTVCNHSGYKLLGSVTHDQHHHFNNCEYGTDTFCDRLFHTTFSDRNPHLVAEAMASKPKSQ